MFKRTFSTIVLVALTAVSTAHAEQAFWKPQEVKIRFNGKGSSSSFPGIFQKMLITQEMVDCSYYQDDEYRTQAGTCYETTCTGGTGKSEAWNEFYNAKAPAKAGKLDRAIEGIGDTSAKKLMAAGFFKEKPRSWEEFKSEITRAANQGVITSQVKTLVLSTNRLQNMANLGYSANNCKMTAFDCGEEVVLVRKGGYVPQMCPQAVERVVDQRAVNYTFDVSGADLLPSETENITVSLTGDPSEAKVASSYYNKYAYQTVQPNLSNATMTLQGIGRKQVPLPEDGLQSVTLTANSPTQATLQVNVSSAILPATGTEFLEIRYTVRTCQQGYVFCGGTEKTKTYVGKIKDNVNSYVVPVEIEPGRNGVKMVVDVSLSKQNSIFHTPVPITKSTDKIPLKK